MDDGRLTATTVQYNVSQLRGFRSFSRALPQCWWPSCPKQAKSSEKKNPSSSLRKGCWSCGVVFINLEFEDRLDSSTQMPWKWMQSCISVYYSEGPGRPQALITVSERSTRARKQPKELPNLGCGRKRLGGRIWPLLGHQWNYSRETAGIVCFQARSPPTLREGLSSRWHHKEPALFKPEPNTLPAGGRLRRSSHRAAYYLGTLVRSTADPHHRTSWRRLKNLRLNSSKRPLWYFSFCH